MMNEDPCEIDNWQPWSAASDTTDSPFIRWFIDALTNAAFNEMDRHTYGDAGHCRTAFYSEEEYHENVTISKLNRDSIDAAHVLKRWLPVYRGADSLFHQRVVLFATNTPRTVVWMAGCKRLGSPYAAVAAGASSTTLASRAVDLAPYALLANRELESTARAALATMPSPPELFSDIDDECLFERYSGERLTTRWPVDASFPLFILHTSGSTGKPKGIVHCHGGYQVGLCVTARLVMGLSTTQENNNDVLFVVATPGWITGQSYMISASLLTSTPSVLLEGSPVNPPTRFAEVIESHEVTILKAGSTMVRMLMASPNADEALSEHNLDSLRLGCFCAEPLSATVHAFARTHLCDNFINCYWATEHGGIVFGRLHGAADEEQPLRSNGRCWPLPYIHTIMLVADGENMEDGGSGSTSGEAGELILRAPLPPYMALTVWGDAGTFGVDMHWNNEGTSSFASVNTHWRGDLGRWKACFKDGWGYAQGDAAVRHPDGSYSITGRADADCLNVAGHRLGAAEIESALLLFNDEDDEEGGDTLADCAVVGVDDALSGTAIVAFLVLRNALEVSDVTARRLSQLVADRLGWPAVPTHFVPVPSLPKTHSGKYMREILRRAAAAAEEDDRNATLSPSELAACANPECVPLIIAALRDEGARARCHRFLSHALCSAQSGSVSFGCQRLRRSMTLSPLERLAARPSRRRRHSLLRLVRVCT